MSAHANAQYSVAATRVFGTMELLEMILLDVAHAEIDLQPSTTSDKHYYYNTYIRSPILLRAVNRDFRNTIDGSSKLLRLRLKAVPPQSPYRIPYGLSVEDFGPLHWLGKQHGGWSCIQGSWFRDGVLRICMIIHDAVRSDNEDKMSEDIEGSWRELPCSTNWNLVSEVETELHCVKLRSYRIINIVPVQSPDLGSRPTLGMVFDLIYRTRIALRIKQEAKEEEEEAEEEDDDEEEEEWWRHD